jgi:hypothetical protein
MPPSASCSTCHVERAAVSGTQMLMAKVYYQLLDTKPHQSRHCSPLSQDKTAVSNPALPTSMLASSALSPAQTLACTGRPRPRRAQSSRLALSNRTKMQSRQQSSGDGTLSNSLFHRTTVPPSMSEDAGNLPPPRCAHDQPRFLYPNRDIPEMKFLINISALSTSKHHDRRSKPAPILTNALQNSGNAVANHPHSAFPG